MTAPINIQQPLEAREASWYTCFLGFLLRSCRGVHMP